MKARFLVPLKVRIPDGSAKPPYVPKPAGYIHEQHDAYLLVQHGCAEPADDECRQACGMTPEQMEHAKKSYKRIAAGIQPEDYAAFDAGLMIGYDPNGEPIPGPNAEHDEEDLEFDEDETDDLDEEVTDDEGTQ